MTPPLNDEATRIEETHDRCGKRLLRIAPEDTSDVPDDVCVICDDCGVVVRYEKSTRIDFD